MKCPEIKGGRKKIKFFQLQYYHSKLSSSPSLVLLMLSVDVFSCLGSFYSRFLAESLVTVCGALVGNQWTRDA